METAPWKGGILKYEDTAHVYVFEHHFSALILLYLEYIFPFQIHESVFMSVSML